MNPPPGMELAAAILERYEREQRRHIADRLGCDSKAHMRLMVTAQTCKASRYRLADEANNRRAER